ncbi:lipoprotein [Streptococcus gordonii]|uniref:DUF6287 domain-containing protein n=1 Tax=Streptococcus gordonii TaxID=1302 RepID=UPI0007791DDD|nr:DUF6287 domain-containing protein [Streptococcus gordonii]VTT00382.1 lipoprotein [Streptococcus gordonii]
MKTIKFTFLVVMSLATCFFLSACGNKQESATSSSSKVTQTTKSSEKSETSSTMEKATGNSSKQDANTNQKEDTTTQMATASMDIQAIAGGDFSSVAGTWTNDLGDQLTFKADGTSIFKKNDGKEIANNTLYDGKIQDGKYVVGFGYASAGSSDPLFFIPKGAPMPVTGNECPKEQLQLGSDATYAAQHPYYRVAN